MRVIAHTLDASPLEALVVSDPEDSDHVAGETVAYLCPVCCQADETHEQVYHDADCQHAGEHGRAHYDEFVPDVPGRPHPELSEAHPLTMIRAGETTANHRAGELIGWYCDECGNADEDAFEIVHDRPCGLATDYDDVRIDVDCSETPDIQPRTVPDGGQ